MSADKIQADVADLFHCFRYFSRCTAEQFDALPKALFLGDDAVMMDVAGDYAGMIGEPIQNARLLIIARTAGGSIEFCKMLGSAADVAAQRDAFVQFCGSVRKAQ